MFLRASHRKKDGKTHSYWSIVENKRLPNERIVQRHVLHLGEINSSQEYAWRKSIAVFSEDHAGPPTLSLFPEDRAPRIADESIVRIRLDQISLRRCRQFGACWLASVLYYDLRLDWFWAERLPQSRKGTRWDLILQTLVIYRLLAQELMARPWQQARPCVQVKLFEQGQELYVLASSEDRKGKERSMRRRKLKLLVNRLQELQKMSLQRDELLRKVGAAEAEAGRGVKGLLEITVAKTQAQLGFKLRRDKLRVARRREGQYLLRTNQVTSDPQVIWEQYLQLGRVEEAFRDLKGDLAIRPIHHQLDRRIEAHIFVAFQAYCLHAHLHRRLTDLAPGLTPRAVLEKLETLSMVDVHLPTSDGREVVLSRVTEPEPGVRLLLERILLTLPEQPPPRITSEQIKKLA